MKQTQLKVPLVSLELKTYLENNYNNNDYKSLNTLEELKYTQGQHSVVDHLLSLYQHQNKNGNILKNVSKT